MPGISGVSAEIKRPHFRRSKCQHRGYASGARNGHPAQSRRARRAFLLTEIQTCLTIEVGRRSGGVCWRATPRNTRLDSSRTMGRARLACARKKHIGPIDPDACTLNQFLNSLEIRATTDVLVDGGDVWIKMLAHCGAHCIGRAKCVPDSR